MIKDIYAREILDSRGYPTIEVRMTLLNGLEARASVPSGASTGEKEALELRDNTKRYFGRGVLCAVRNVNEIIKPGLVGKRLNQKEIDEFLIKLDGTKNKSKLGANAMLAVSIAAFKLSAKVSSKELFQNFSSDEVSMPIPMVNIINGGAHANNNLAIQEFMIVPFVKGIKEKIRLCSEVFHALKTNLNSLSFSTSVGDEGGFAPSVKNSKEALDLIVKSIIDAGYKPKREVFIALDAAASEFYLKEEEKYEIDGKKLSKDELLNYYIDLVNIYPIISIEDPFYEEDFDSLKKITDVLGSQILIVGDDYFCTNEEYLQRGIEKRSANAILLKPNQIGTMTEFLNTVRLAKENNYKLITSHRSGETTDDFLADFAVGISSEFIKTGSITRGERVVKYNRLMEIEDILKSGKR